MPGSAGTDPNERSEVRMGCYCFMPLKAKFRDSSCWINDLTGSMVGWHEQPVSTH